MVSETGYRGSPRSSVPGIGKSRLLAEVASRAADDAAVLWGRCLSYGEGITYWPMVEIVKGAAGILKSDDKDTAISRSSAYSWRSIGSDDLDELRTMAAAIANLIGVPRTPRGTYSAADISQAELHWGIRRVLELLAARRPLMLVFEDLHWAEETLFDLIDFLRAAEAPIFVVGTGRRELEQLRPMLCSDGDQRIAVPLAALDEAESEALLARLLGAHDVPAGRHAELLLRNAAGNPLFLEETVRMLADSGALEAGGDLSELAVPTSLNAMIGSRLDALPSQDKRIAQYASVVGMTFWSGAVADLQGSDVESTRASVRSSSESSCTCSRRRRSPTIASGRSSTR